jgi:heme exporter protein D
VKEFLAMGGYAAYVWTAYGVTTVVIGLNVWLANRRLRQVRTTLQRSTGATEPARRPTVRRVR